MAVINKVTLPSEDLYDVQTLSIPFGQVDSTSTATAFTATIPGITSLYDGVCVYLKNGVITSASGWTLNINDLGAKPVYQTQAAASRTTTIFNVAYTGLFVYNSSRVDGGCWDYFYGYNSDTNTTAYQIRGNQTTLKMYAALTRYKVCFSRFDGSLLPSTATSNSTGTSKTLTTESFDPHGLIYYYNTTTGVAVGESPGVSYMWIHYPTADLRYCFNTGTTLVAKEPVYVQCSPQTDGSFKLSGNDCIVQELPSTNDGYAYIYLGKAYDTYRMSLDLHHPIYCYKNGAIIQWGSGSGTTPNWDENDSTSGAYIANRTHYRTSLGAMSNLHPLILSGGNWGEGPYTGESGNTYGFVGTWDFDFNDDYDSLMSDFPDGSITLLDLENPEIVVIADGTELELNYIKTTSDDYNTYTFYNSDFEISYTDGNNGYMPNGFGVASNTDYQSIEIKLKTSTEIFEYHTLDDRYLNGGLIKSGTGTQSEIFNGGIALTEAYQLHITGEADAVEYDFESVPIPVDLSLCCSAIKVEGHDDIKVVALYNLDDDLTQNVIKFNKTFDADNALEDYPITIIAPFRIASGDYSHLEGKARYAPGEASHAEGDGTTASGNASHAEGGGTTASGSRSHAEGSSTTASGNYSHAEGTNTTASGDYSHAEGTITTASGDDSHAEGYNTTASGYYSHAEGRETTASGNMSHAEGSGTTASGSMSHAEGYNTTAQRRSQHVFGEYNVLDASGIGVTVKGSYIEIVGNGTSTGARSNARTLDWSGNEVLAGKLTVGAAPTNNMDVTTKQYVDNSISTAITDINSFNTAIVQSLPTTDIDTHTIYFISNSGSGTNVYDEYIYVNSNWEKIGSTSIDLSNYLAKDNTTSYTPTGDYNPATKKYVDDNAKDLFVVTITSTTTEGVTTYSADKTFAEITAAYNARKECIATLGSSNYIYRLQRCTSSKIIFVVLDYSSSLNRISLREIEISSSNEITMMAGFSLETLGTSNSKYTYKDDIAVVNGTVGANNHDFTFSSTAIQAYSTGDLFWISSEDLAKATTDIASGATLTENTNYVKTTIADELKSAGSQSDWEEADTTDSSYILNKPSVKAGDGENSVMIGQLDVPLEELEPSATLLVTGDAKATTYTYTTEDNLSGLTRISTVAVYNNKVYSLAASIDTTNNTITFTSTLSITAAVTNVEVKLYKMKKIVVGSNATAEGLYTAASGGYSHAEGSNTRAIGSSSHSEGNATSAVGTASHAEGGSTTAPGTYSHAEGFYATASGNYSHAEGHYTTASGNPSHAEGSRTTASGAESHAEGLETTASGVASHSEGGLTKASGDASHAEGYYSVATHGGAHAEGWKGTSSVTLAGEANVLTYTVTDGPYLRNANRSTTMTVEYNSAFYPVTAIVLNSSGILTSVTLESTLNDSAAVSANATIHIGNLASGMGAHAEGEATHAAGPGSHAEGLNTIAVECAHAEGSHTLASSSYQHVQGKHNIEDSNGVYAHIVGNGTSSEARSNAHTLDWNGNGWYAGKVSAGTVESPANPTAANDLATKAYVDELAGGFPDWNENDSTSDSYIENRTHYRTPIDGNIATINLTELIRNTSSIYGEYTLSSINKTYSFETYLNSEELDQYLNLFPNNSLLDLNLESSDYSLDINDGSYSLNTLYVANDSTFSDISTLYLYNDSCCVILMVYTDSEVPYIVCIVYSSYDINYGYPISLHLPFINNVYAYSKIDSKYLDGVLVQSGKGFNSEIFNGIEGKEAIGSYSHVEGYSSNELITMFVNNSSEGPNIYGFELLDSDMENYYRNLVRVMIGAQVYDNNGPIQDCYVSVINFNSHYMGTTASIGIEDSSAKQISISISGAVAIGTGSHVEGCSTKAIGLGSHAEGEATTASGSDSHAEGEETTASGDNSHAEGSSTTASGYISHAEGNNTTASGNYSHAEGSNTTASGNSSHAEGNRTTASGDYSHAEGEATTASGSDSHVEGSSTTASGYASHAEGISTTASGNYSHAEGAGTTAQRRSQHVFGEYNVLDTTGASKSSKGSYIEIVGKGTGDNARSNARTLDWSGNEVLAGKLTVGTDPTNNMDVATKQYVDNAVSGGGGSSTLVDLTDTSITSPTNGQILIYNSTTSKWENTSIPKEVMVVTMTSTGSGDNITYSADKTYSEILTHINNGGTPIVYYQGKCYHLNYFDSYDEEICFSFSYLSSGGLVIFAEYVYISPNGSNFANCNTQRLDVSLGISGNVIQLKNGDNTVMSSVTLPVYNGGVSS